MDTKYKDPSYEDIHQKDPQVVETADSHGKSPTHLPSLEGLY